MSTRPGAEVSGTLAKVLVLNLLLALVPLVVMFGAGADIPFQVAVAGVYLLQMLILGSVLVYYGAVPKRVWFLVAVLFGVSQCLSLWSSVLYSGTFEVLDLVNAFSKAVGVLVYAGAVSVVSMTRIALDRFLRWVLGIAVVAIGFNFIQNAGDFSAVFSVASAYQINFSSFFANRNQFGHFLFISIFVHLMYLAGRRLRLSNVVLFTMQGASLLLTLSRGSIAAVVALVGVVFLLRWPKRPLLNTSVVLGGGALLWVVLSGSLAQVFNRLFVRSDVGLAGRDVVWSYGLGVWRDTSTLFGVGFYRGLEIATERGMMFGEFHSFFVESLVSGGVVEVLLIGGLVIYSAIVVVRSQSLDRPIKNVFVGGYVALGVLASVESISFFTIGFVGTVFTTFFIALPNLLKHGFIGFERQEPPRAQSSRRAVADARGPSRRSAEASVPVQQG